MTMRQYQPVREQLRPLTLEELKKSALEHEILDFWLRLSHTIEGLYGKEQAASAILCFKLGKVFCSVDTISAYTASGKDITTYDYSATGWTESLTDTDSTTLLEGLDAHIRASFEESYTEDERADLREMSVDTYLSNQGYFLTKLGVVPSYYLEHNEVDLTQPPVCAHPLIYVSDPEPPALFVLGALQIIEEDLQRKLDFVPDYNETGWELSDRFERGIRVAIARLNALRYALEQHSPLLIENNPIWRPGTGA